MTDSENMSYVIFKTDEDEEVDIEDKAVIQYEVTNEDEIIEALVQKHKVDRYGISNELQNQKWEAIHKEFMTLTESYPTIEDLKIIWRDLKNRKKNVKSLEDSIANTLGKKLVI